MNPAEFLTISSAVVADREALVSGDGSRRVTYEAMGTQVARLTNALMGMGITAGSRVAVMATNSPEYVEVYYACAKLGACFVPINFRAKREELAHMLNVSDSTVLFIERRYLDIIESIRGELEDLQRIVVLDAGLEEENSFASL